jgi:hypothetical protein
VVHEHAAPVEWDGNPENFPRLRIVLRGLGQVRVASAELTDGRKMWRVQLPKKNLGRPAPQGGWPDLDWQRTTDEVVCEFEAVRASLG